MMSKLTMLNIPSHIEYPGFLFKLFIDYKGAMVVINTLQQAKEFETRLEIEVVEVEILNLTPEERQNRRKSAICKVGIENK